MDGKGIVITGANGQLGRALQKVFPAAVAGDREMLDITDKASVEGFDWSGVRVIINAAAYTNVDGAQTPEGAELARKINVDGVANLADVARARDLTLVHISTDYVFDGTRQNHLETEDFHPLSVYGETKAAGDEYIMRNLTKYYILRTSWLIGEGKNFVRTMFELGAKGVSPKVINDQFGRLTFTDELTRIIAHLLGAGSDFGVYNASNYGQVKSWFDITRDIFRLAGFAQDVVEITTEEYFLGKENVAKRPRYSDFNLEKLHGTGFESADWEIELEKYIEQLK